MEKDSIMSTLRLNTREAITLNAIIDAGCGLKVRDITDLIGGNHELNNVAIEKLENMNLVYRDVRYDYIATESASVTILDADSYSIYFTGDEQREDFDAVTELRNSALEADQEGNGYIVSMIKDSERFRLTDSELNRHVVE